jgi:hypothetical protein
MYSTPRINSSNENISFLGRQEKFASFATLVGHCTLSWLSFTAYYVNVHLSLLVYTKQAAVCKSMSAIIIC